MRPADWLVERFGLDAPATLTGPVDRGLQGQVWRLDCPSGAYAVKETFGPIEPDQVALAYELQTRAERLGVHAPRQLLTADGGPAVVADGETLRLFDWVQLRGPDRQLDPVAVGLMLARLHLAGGATDQPVDAWFLDPVGQDRWVELIAELRLAGAPFADELDAMLTDLTAAESIMEPARDVLICHRDLWADNVRAGADGRPVVIDWDNCGPASAAGELAMALAEYGNTPERARDLYAAYLEASGPARLTGLGNFTMPVAVLHHLVELGATQWLAAAGDHARERAAGRVREFTGDPFGLDQVRSLQQALGF